MAVKVGFCDDFDILTVFSWDLLLLRQAVHAAMGRYHYRDEVSVWACSPGTTA